LSSKYSERSGRDKDSQANTNAQLFPIAVPYSPQYLTKTGHGMLNNLIAPAGIELDVRTHRAEIVVAKTAKTIAAFDGRREVTMEDIKEAMELALPHRMRRKPFEQPFLEKGKIEAVMSMSILIRTRRTRKKNTNKTTQQFPTDEKFGLTSQIRRSAVSVAANIAEGSKRQHLKEYIQMLYISHGSLSETEYYLLLSRDLKYLNVRKYQELFNLSEEIGRMLKGLIKSLSHPKREEVKM
jgi:four helix bundle protein